MEERSVRDRKAEDETLKRLAAIGEMSAGIAHEIRNPLTSVKGFLQLLSREFPHHYWDVVFPELDQAIDTVQNLLSVSKPNLVEEPLRKFSLCTDLENVLSLFNNEMYRVTVQKRFFNTEIKIYGKRNQVKKALFNLLKNAFEAIDGTGTISVEHYTRDGFVYVVIEDSGRGIPEDKLHLLGTPFFSMKTDGTGMGLPQVYSTMYEVGAEIKVESACGKGTKFVLQIPITSDNVEERLDLDLSYKPDQDVRDFFEDNRMQFNKSLEQEAKSTFEIVSHSTSVTTKDLIDHANQIVGLVHNGVTQDIIKLAQERGIAWAKSDIPIITKMEWFYALRRVIWRFLKFYHSNQGVTPDEVFELADRISEALDNFIIHFNVSFTRYRDEILKSQQQIIDELTVPVIPVFKNVAVLPLIGTIDEVRIQRMEERLLEEIEVLGIRKIFIDFSAAILKESSVIHILYRMIDGVGLLGCRAVLTGIRAQTARMMLDMNEKYTDKVIIEATLQQALIKESTHL